MLSLKMPTTPPPERVLPSDADLVAATLAGDRDAFAALATRYARTARATAADVLGDLHLASDAAQDALVEAYRNLATLRDPASFGPWLLTIARNRAKRMAKQRRPVRPLEEAMGTPHPSAGVTLDEQDQALLRALNRLPEHERVVVMLRHFEGYDVRRIADATGRSPGTVTKQLSRAHERMKRWLEGASR